MSCIKCIHHDICVRHYICGFNKEAGCRDFKNIDDLREIKYGTWKPYSTTMMECSICGRHTARHRYEFCPHCGAKMFPNVQVKEDTPETWKQLSLFDQEDMSVE